MSKQGFVATIKSYCDQQPAGDKHHLRQTDELAGACSPMMLYGVPVGKMFFEGAPRIGSAGVSVLPCRPNESSRIVVEAYPALVAGVLLGEIPTRTAARKLGRSNLENRRRIINSLPNCGCESDCITVHIANSLRRTAHIRSHRRFTRCRLVRDSGRNREGPPRCRLGNSLRMLTQSRVGLWARLATPKFSVVRAAATMIHRGNYHIKIQRWQFPPIC